MARHTWRDWEMVETLRVARLPRQQWPREIAALTQAIRERTDPEMDEGRVGVAVQAAENLVADRPGVRPQGSGFSMSGRRTKAAPQQRGELALSAVANKRRAQTCHCLHGVRHKRIAPAC